MARPSRQAHIHKLSPTRQNMQAQCLGLVHTALVSVRVVAAELLQWIVLHRHTYEGGDHGPCNKAIRYFRPSFLSLPCPPAMNAYRGRLDTLLVGARPAAS
eukprot:356894-Chlamydomonas_euryale.AAC.10